MRKRFNAAERELITSLTGQPGTPPVEWQNVTQWRRGLLIGGITRDADGWETVLVENRDTTRTISAGQRLPVGPGHLRAAS